MADHSKKYDILMKTKDVVNYILLGVVGMLIFCLSDYIEWYGDSLCYRFHFGTGEPIKSFQDVISSQYAHYFEMNGRIWAHVLCQGFSALWGKTAFAVCNALVYILFVMLFAKVCGRSWKRLPDLLICILMILFLCDTSYNANCQIGYIWTSTATLAFLILYFGAKKTKKYHWWSYALLLLVSFLAGDGNEAIAIGVGAALIVDFLRNLKKFNLAQIVMIAGFGIGGLMLCLSPGILKRASGETANLIWSVYGLLFNLRTTYILLITLAILKFKHRILIKRFLSDNMFFIVALVTLLVFNLMIGIGQNHPRQLFGIELFSAILTIRALNGVKIPKWLMIILSVVVAGIYVMKFDYLRKSNEDLVAMRKQLTGSEDLKVYLDFHRYPPFVHPTEMTNNFEIYFFVASAICDDILDFGHHYYTFRINNELQPYFKTLAIYPTVMKDIIKSDDKNFAAKCDDGLYLVVRDNNNPKRFFLNRNFNIFGIKFPKEPYEIQFPYSSGGEIDIVYSDFNTPLIETGEIIIDEEPI